MLTIFRNVMSQNRVSTGFLVDFMVKNAETTIIYIATFYARNSIYLNVGK